MRSIAADLHVHSALSPCADDSMIPQTIVYSAIAAELEMIAICDHNSAGNVAAVQEAAGEIAGDLFCVIAGIEITTREEAHIVGLFPDAAHALAASEEVADYLPDIGDRGNPYGRQLLMNSAGDLLGEAAKLLSFASGLSLSETVALIRRHHGLAIAAHIDRPTYSVISQLGFLPEDVRFDALEISEAGVKQGRAEEFRHHGIPLLSSSDAHYPGNIGDGKALFSIEMLSFDEIRSALRGENDRECRLA